MLAPRDLQHDFYDMLMESQYWPPEQLLAYQREQLEHLVRHARANVPFYETRLDCLFTRTGTIDWDRWTDVPIVTRQDLVDCEMEMQARSVPPMAGRVGKSLSSGTTGVATRTSQTELSVVMSDAALIRAYDWHQLDYTRTMVSFAVEDPTKAVWPKGEHRGCWVPGWTLRQGRGQLYEINRAATPSQVLDYVDRCGAEYIAGGTVRSQAIALEALRLGARHEIDLVLTRGAAVTDECRNLLNEAFGARAVGLYSAKEAHKIAHPCPTADVYHINAELLLLEIVDLKTGSPSLPGDPGRVLVTPFFNMAQPLIRYDIGDLAIMGERCACGRTLPVLKAIVGRELHMFIMPDGARMVPSIPNAETRRLNAAMWQMAQVGPNNIEIRRVPRPDSSPVDVEAFTATVRQNLWRASTFGLSRSTTSTCRRAASSLNTRVNGRRRQHERSRSLPA